MNDEVKKKAPPAVSLKTLLTSSKTVEFEFPELDGFIVQLNYLAREEMVKLRNKCVSQKFNKKTRSFEESLDDDKFLELYVESVIKGWKGLKLEYLSSLILINEGYDPESELEFSVENANVLMKNSNTFDTWVTEMVGNLENFTNPK
jgi:hypothetical protein